MPRFDFANILFAGPCNRFCPFCIGKEVAPHANVYNLDVFPPRNWKALVKAVHEHNICELVFTGTTTDPQLYTYERELIELARSEMPGIRISIHTNGALALRKIGTFNAYDRACISFPSFEMSTYERMMGSRHVPDLAALVAASKIPVKVSCVVNEHNAHEIEDFIAKLRRLGIRRLVLRQLFQDTHDYEILRAYTPTGVFRSNPVYNIHGIEVTHWNFDTSTLSSINLFADGTLGTNYLLTETQAWTA